MAKSKAPNGRPRNYKSIFRKTEKLELVILEVLAWSDCGWVWLVEFDKGIWLQGKFPLLEIYTSHSLDYPNQSSSWCSVPAECICTC